MRKLNKVFVVLLAIVFLASVTPVFAGGARYGIKTSQTIETTGILNDQEGNAMDYAVWVYGVTIYADAASSAIGLYDCDTTLELQSATLYPRYEVGEPTQYETTTVWFEKPLYFSDGVGAVIFTGVGFVHYGPEPTG